jgi:hypothetical protein
VEEDDGDTRPWRCLDASHEAGCRRCTPPPLGSSACVLRGGRPRAQSGEKQLRGALCRTPEWRNADTRNAAADALDAAGATGAAAVSSWPLRSRARACLCLRPAAVAAAAAAPTSAADAKLFTTPGYRRPLHWVFKVGDLQATLEFYERALGMKVRAAPQPCCAAPLTSQLHRRCIGTRSSPPAARPPATGHTAAHGARPWCAPRRVAR